MKKKVNILIHSIILIFILALFVGNSAVRADEAEQAVDINYKKATVNIGDEDNVLQLKMENWKEGDKKPRWVSYNVNVATVDQYGYVTPLRKGSAIISSGIGFPRKICVVTVVDPSVKLNKTAATIYRSDENENENTPGNTITLTAKVNGATKKATDVVWSSSDTSVAKVVPDTKGRGVVTAVDGADGKAGTAVITARVNGRTASCKVTVLNSTISLNVNEMQLSTKGAGSSIKLVPTVVGSKKAVTWTSSDKATATVSGGKVTGKKAGTATVTAKANGVEKTCTVTVVEGQISINEENVLLYVTKTKNTDGEEELKGETKELKTNAAKNDVVEWSSSNKGVVTVEGKANGKAAITAVGAGRAVITATCNDKTDTCVVEVKKSSTSIVEKNVYLKTKGVAKTYTLGYQVVGRKNTVTWKSLDPKVVSVSKGKVTAKKAGTATVTMTANGVTDEVQVIVQNYAPTIALNQNEYTLYTTGSGTNVTLKATVDGPSKKVVWKSSAGEVAEVTAKGKVTAKKEGRALITVTANDVTANCWVSVRKPAIIMEKDELILKPNENVNLYEYASIEVIGAKQSVKYISSDKNTATVNAKGIVTAKKEGKAVITITANGVEEKCNVTVSTCEEHTFGPVKIVSEASCEENGLTEKECTVCGGKEQEVTDPSGHSFGKWIVVDKATENAAGLQRQECVICGAENTRIIPAKHKGEVADGYKLMWEDDFDGDTLDRDSWNVELHDPGWVNEEWQRYVDSPDNIYVKDGNLVIQAIKDETKADGDKDQYTSGRINTQNKHDYTYGRFEARAKVPSGQGFLPAFWMMPTDEDYYGQWPKCGEIDIMEVLGQETNKAYSTLHFGEPHTQKQGNYTLPDGQADFSEEFHVYACEWDPDEFRFYVDDQLIYTVNDWFTKKAGFSEKAYPAPYDQPFYMILNLAVSGSWVGEPDETTKFGDNAQLVVDYVRVYQKNVYDTDVEKPEKAEVILRDPDDDGNYIINGDFAKVEDLVKGDENWQLLTASGGKATAEIKENELHITTTAVGTENHSVQIVQANLPIAKGGQYKLTFDAYADEGRTMITDISAPDRNWDRYLKDTTVTLTTEKKPYEYTFEMTSDDDANGRLEFNLGKQESLAQVHISNVKLVRVDNPDDGDGDDEEEPVDEKGFQLDGNYVYNGSFDEGNEVGKLRLAYWDWNIDKCKGASVSVTGDTKRELKVVVPKTVNNLGDVVVYQESIAITGGGKTYKVSFDAYADQEKTIKTVIAGKEFTSDLTTAKNTFTYDLNIEEELNGSELRFLLGAAGATYIDNVSIRKVGADTGLIVNGDFSSGLNGFDPYVDSTASASYTISFKENEAFSIDITDTGDQDWKIQLKQNNVKLEKDTWYKIGFDAKSTMDRKIMYALQRDGSKHKTPDGKEDWIPYSGSQTINLTGEWQNFSHTFKMTEDTDPETILSISMGAVGGTQIKEKHTVLIDNITLVETAPVEIAPVEEGKEMIENGDFSEGKEHWEDYVDTAYAAAEVTFTNGEDGKATYRITNIGTEDHHIQLKYAELLTLEKGAEYMVSFKIKSTATRIVKYAFLNPSYDWYGGEDLELTADVEKEVNYKLKVDRDTSDQITFQISMGQIYDHWDEALRKPIDTPISTIEIDDISVKKIGGDTEEEPIEPVEPNTEMIQNGDFSKGKEGWTESGIINDGDGTESFEDEKAVYEITNVGTEDWHVQLKQTGLTLEKGSSYKVSFKINSTAARKVKLKLQNPNNYSAYYYEKPISLSGDDDQTVEEKFTVNSNSCNSIIFVIAMGKIDDETIPTHTIEIDDVSLVKVSEDTEEDPIEPVDPGTELIENGDFKGGKGIWGGYIHEDGGAKATPEFKDNKARYEIFAAGEADWNVQLKQGGLKMEKDATYKVNVEIGSSIDRDVRLVFLNTDNGECASETISLTKNKVKSVSRIVTLNDQYTSGTLAFQLSMGNYKVDDSMTSLEPHAIEIFKISVIKVTDEAKADEETERGVTIAPPAESGEEPEQPEDPDEENLIKNGDFSEGRTNWTGGIAEEEGVLGTEKFDPANKKVVYTIEKIGTDDWHVQLKQENLTLETGAEYKVSFKIKSTVERTVKSAIMNYVKGGGEEGKDLYDWYAGAEPSLTAGVEETVTYDVKVGNKETSSTIQFVISMGKIGDEEITEEHTIEISDIRLIKVKDGTDTEEKPGTETTPPADNTDDDASDNSGNAAEVQNDQNTEDQDGKSDETADDEGADEDTSNSQNDSGAEETPDDQSDSGSQNESEIAGDGEVEP